jgi:hypothetical protein
MMLGGIISGNTSNYNYGGGVCVFSSAGHFTKRSLSSGGSSGIIYGSGAGTELANTAADNAYGHAVYFATGGKKRNTTLGGFDEISTENVNIGWE